MYNRYICSKGHALEAGYQLSPTTLVLSIILEAVSLFFTCPIVYELLLPCMHNILPSPLIYLKQPAPIS